ncbi:MAG TPA: hypothetical protein VHA57_06570 [Actinomycetota bacterium]|nr:hypothetical protein [Actinomycetota bacterium]
METVPRRGRGRPHGAGRSGRKLLAALVLTALSLVVSAVVARRRSRPQGGQGGPPGAQGGFAVEGQAARPGNGHGPAAERRASADPQALQALLDGTPSRLGFDVERLATLKEANYKPLMEYLQYIQVQRGGSDTLVFVRSRDLDKLAGLVGQSRDEFLSQFKKLGILLSMN